MSLTFLSLAPLALSAASAASNADSAWQKAGADDGLRQAFERAAYSLEDSGHGTWRGTNAAQRLALEFNGGEARLSHPDGSVNFHLTGYGYGDRIQEPAPAKLTGTGNRVEYQRGDLTEWYVNGSQGLEQGFTLAQRPGTDRGGEALVIAIGVSGGLRPVKKTDDGAVLFESAKGVVLRYAGLKVLDARGRTLPSRLEVQGSEIRLIVEDDGAQYPLVVDPLVVDPLWTQQQELTAADGSVDDQFAFAVSVSGDTAVIGAYSHSISQGVAYVFVRSGSTWSLQQKLTASDAVGSDGFGISVSVSGNTAVIGAYGKTVNSNVGQGAAYVFVRSGGAWTQQQELTASDGAAGDSFGRTVSVSGDTVAIGTWSKAINSNTDQGVAYVFVRSGGIWTQQQELTASDGAANDHFGTVSVSGSTVLVGALGSGSMQGAAYVFVGSGGSWSQQQKLTVGGTFNFGQALSVSNDTAVIGAYDIAYVFVRSGGVWTQQQALTGSDVVVNDQFGTTVNGVSVSGDTAVIGAWGKNNGQGAAYVFVRSGGVWTQQQELTASDGVAASGSALGDEFGSCVSVSGDTVVMGAPYKTLNSQPMQGAAYVFVRPRLGTSSLLVGSAGGTSSVVLSYDAAWTATANDSFLHIASGSDSGTGSAVVVFTYDAFTGTGTRTGTLTIAGQTVTVTQAGENYTGPFGPGPAITLVSSGLSWPTGAAVDGFGNVYIADNQNNAIKEWSASTQQVTTLVSSGLTLPTGVAVDNSGNVYITSQDGTVKEWNASTQHVTTLMSSGLNQPIGAAVDGAGNIYIADTDNNAIKVWSVATQQVTTLVSSGLDQPDAVAVDASGNVYIADQFDNAIKEWSTSTQQVTTLAGGGRQPSGVAVDGSGNVYFVNRFGDANGEWSGSTHQVTALSSGMPSPMGTAVDGAGNVYVANTGPGALYEVPYAFVGPATLTEPASAGTDSLLPVLPSTASLTGVFAPISDSNWLTIGTIANGVANFSYSANTSALSRVAHIAILGQQITVTQSGMPLVPSVHIDAPAAGATVSGTVTISGWAIDNASTVGTAISSVQVLVDGIAVGTATTTSRADVCAVFPGRPGCPNVGFSYSLNAATLAAGSHTITVTAADSNAIPDTGSSSVTVTAPAVIPSVHIDAPAAGATVSGTVTISGWAIDSASTVGTAISSVQVLVDGVAVGTATATSRADVCAVFPGRPGCPNVGFSYALNTAALTAGSHTITVSATDSANPPDTGSSSVTVTVTAPAVIPSVHIDAPAPGATVSGTVTVTGWAIDNASTVGTAISGVHVLVDGVAVGTATGTGRADVCAVFPGRPGCPNVGFSYALNTAALIAGSHTITVSATDSATPPDTGSSSVTVTVTAPAVIPSVHIDAPAPGGTVSGTVTISGWAIDNASTIGTAISSVQVLVDGIAVGTALATSRPDVCAVFPGRPGCPNVGFSYALNTAALTAGSHTITVSATDSASPTDTGSSSVTVTVTASAVIPSVHIDMPAPGATVSGTATVSGWAIDNASTVGTAISSVQVLVDGVAVGTATATSRPDVCAVFPGRPGCPNVGFSYSLNTAALASGPHTITAAATDSASPPDTGSTTITVQK